MRLAAAALILLASSASAADLTDTVNHVRDGDTIEVGGVAIRLQGLHAPELDETDGPEAAAFMAELDMGQDVTCDLTGERSHDELIGVCFLDGRDIAAELIAAGLGRDCAWYSGGRYAAIDRRPDMPLPVERAAVREVPSDRRPAIAIVAVAIKMDVDREQQRPAPWSIS